MATSGWSIVSNVRNGDGGLRVPRHGVVERAVERAVLKAGMGRIDASTWLEAVQTQMRGGPVKKL